MLLAGLAVFGLASVAGGLTSTPGQLIVARCVMGLGAAMIFPATLSLISNVFTERGERARAIGLWGATTGVAIALGPIVGGWLLERFSWASIFFAMAPVALSAPRSSPGACRPRAIRARPGPTGPGLVLSSAAMALLIYTIIEAPDHGWSSARSIGGFALAAGLFGVVHRPRAPRAGADARPQPVPQPALHRRERLGDRRLLLALRVHLPDHPVLPVPQGLRAAVHRRAPPARGRRPWAIASVVGTKLAVRFGTKLVVTAGLLLVCRVLRLGLDGHRTGTSYLIIAVQMVLYGTGIGLTSAPATEAIMGVVPTAKAGVGSAVNDATRLLGGTLGVAVIGSVYASMYASRLDGCTPVRSIRAPGSRRPRLRWRGASRRRRPGVHRPREPRRQPPRRGLDMRSSVASARAASSPPASPSPGRSPPASCSPPTPRSPPPM